MPGSSWSRAALVVTAVLLAAVPAHAQEQDEGQLTSQVASYTATKLKDSPAVVTVITGDDIKASGARDLIDILSLVPGFYFGVDNQGVVGPGFRGLWGYEGKILLLIDGKEMNELLYSTIQLGNELAPELIERVEVVRGPGSVIYGGNAELAVINVITRGLQGATEVQVSGTYGQLTDGASFLTSHGRRSLSASGRWVVDEVPGLSTFVSASVGEGQRSVRAYTDNAGTTAPQEGASALDPALVQAGVGYRDWQLTFLYHRLAGTTATAAGLLPEPPASAPVVPSTFDTLALQVQGAFRPTDRIEVVPRLDLTFQHPWATPAEFPDAYYQKWGRRLRGRVIGRWAPLDALQVTLGVDGQWDAAWLDGPATEEGNMAPFGGKNGTGRVNYGTFAAFAEVFSDNPWLTVSAGARVEYHSLVGPSVVPRLVLQRSFGPVSLKGLFSLAFREPGVENLNLGPAAPAVLRPENTLVAELEASWELVKGIYLSANVFDVGITSPIGFIVVDAATQKEEYRNLGKQGSLGAEVTFRARGSWGHVAASYAFSAPAFAFGQVADVDIYLPPGRTDGYLGAPNHHAAVSGTWQALKWLAISPTVVVVGPRSFQKPGETENDPPVAQELPTQVLANLFVSVTDVPVKGLSFGLGIYNLFGTPFAFPQPYRGDYAPLPGLDREVLLKVTYRWEPAGE